MILIFYFPVNIPLNLHFRIPQNFVIQVMSMEYQVLFAAFKRANYE